MIQAAGVRVIHLLSLDVDGAELSVLKTFDWTVPIGVLLVELDGSNRDKDEAVRALLRSHGMRFALRIGFRKYSEVWEGFLSTKIDSRTGQHRLHGGSHGCADPAVCKLTTTDLPRGVHVTGGRWTKTSSPKGWPKR